jgi:hypothetical protein
MTGDPSPFELATAELRKLGIKLRQLPGDYGVNFANSGESTARTLETLDEALATGRAMAAEVEGDVYRRGHLRRRLRAKARSAEKMPWSERDARMWQTVFPNMANWLPDDEAA